MRKRFMIGLSFAAIAAYSCIAIGNAAESSHGPQVSNERQIKITATLQDIAKDAKTWNVELDMETRTHALSEGMEDAAVLIADGKKYDPVGWQGSPPGGRHRKGLLRFKAIVPQPASVELQIRLIGDPSPRSFKWRLK
jgi:hypothetical protein